MLDYTFLKIACWILIVTIVMLYAIRIGYSAGASMIMPLLRSETSRRLVLNACVPVWENHFIWIIFVGGGLLVIWPLAFSTAFSGLYSAMLCILWSLLLRPTGYDYRGRIHSALGRRIWDLGLFISGALPVFIGGVVAGNCLLGFPFYFDTVTFRDFYTGNFFQLFNGFTILSGIVAVLMILMYGAAYMQCRMEQHLQEFTHKLVYIFSFLLLASLSITGLWMTFFLKGYAFSSSGDTLYPIVNRVTQNTGAWINNYSIYPWKYYLPLMALGGLLVVIIANYCCARIICLWGAMFTVAGIVGAVGTTLFPFIMPSSTHPNESLTVWNSTASQFTLSAIFYLVNLLLMLSIGYRIFLYTRSRLRKRRLHIKIDANTDILSTERF